MKSTKQFIEYKNIFLLIFISLLSYSCNVTRKIPAGKYLLAKNTITISYADSIKRAEKVSPSELTRFIPLSQTPNKKVLGGYFFLWIHNMSDSTKTNKFNKFLRRVGESPVLLDTTAMLKISKEMDIYMDAKGYFNAKITDTVQYKKRKANVVYRVTAGAPYIIKSVDYKFNDESLRPIILDDSINSLIKVGNTLNRMTMDSERSRIASMLEDLGYYQFSSANVRYLVDTLKMKNQANITIIINKSNISGQMQNNKMYRVRDIYINTNYEPKVGIDTIKYDTVNMGGLNFIYQRGAKRNIKPDIMARAITIYPNVIYSKEEINYTSANISNLKFFKSANILFSEVASEEDDFVHYINDDVADTLAFTPEGYVDCTILCSPSKRQNYRADFELSTNSNYTGISLTLGYGNKNIFKRAEQFNINATASYDFMRSKAKRDSYEFGVSASLAFPRLAAPRFINRYRNLYRTSTSIDVSYSSQRRPDYDRTLLNASFGYNWTSNKLFSYTFKPLNISLIRVPWIREEFLEDIENPYLRNSYQSQMIFGMFGSFKFSTQNTGRQNNYTVRVNTETSGNFLDLMTTVINSKKVDKDDEQYYQVFGVRYAQYFRTDLDFSYKYTIGSNSSNAIVYRFFAGGGYSYGNTKSIPFERMFYSGGSNSMRGWQIRTLGPGGTPQVSASSYPNQVGDIRLETNIEGRFAIWGPINGALFFDLGNVWSNGIGELNQEARFKWNTFYKQLGFNTGLGVRLDFGFFVLRVDWGIQLHNPGWPAGERWIRDFKFNNTAVHFGIGYPF